MVETVRDGSKISHRTLLRLGGVTALRDSGQLERIVAALEARLQRERLDVDALAAEGAPAVGGVAAVAAVWRRLGLDDTFQLSQAVLRHRSATTTARHYKAARDARVRQATRDLGERLTGRG